jgi:dTDP-4-amino-4,6-dideoxygalactose transaminase
LHVALAAHGLGSGDEVVTSPFSFIASANCILYVGARPVFADIEEAYFTIDPQQIRERITPRTKAILPVHLYGQICDMELISQIAQEYHLAIIEDACQAHGARLNGRPVGSWGTACYSFYPTKNMTTIEGGMITTNDAAIAEKARLVRNHGSRRRYEHDMLGFNFRMTDMQAAIGLAQLRKIDRWNLQRQANAAYISSKIASLTGVAVPKVREGSDHVYHQYTLRVADRERAVSVLKEKGIGFGIHYPTPIHKQPLYQELGYEDSLPRAEAACHEVLSIPVHPALTEADLESIASAVAGF